MKYTILLDKNEKTREIEAQEQARFIKSVLEALEVPVDFNPEKSLSVDDKIKFRTELSNHNINIITDVDGGVKLYLNQELIGEWHKAIYKLKKDEAHIDPKKRLFIEMNVHFWTIFEKD